MGLAGGGVIKSKYSGESHSPRKASKRRVVLVSLADSRRALRALLLAATSSAVVSTACNLEGGFVDLDLESDLSGFAEIPRNCDIPALMPMLVWTQR